jgi:hypothetical protein
MPFESVVTVPVMRPLAVGTANHAARIAAVASVSKMVVSNTIMGRVLHSRDRPPISHRGTSYKPTSITDNLAGCGGRGMRPLRAARVTPRVATETGRPCISRCGPLPG